MNGAGGESSWGWSKSGDRASEVLDAWREAPPEGCQVLEGVFATGEGLSFGEYFSRSRFSVGPLNF